MIPLLENTIFMFISATGSTFRFNELKPPNLTPLENNLHEPLSFFNMVRLTATKNKPMRVFKVKYLFNLAVAFVLFLKP